MGLDGFKFQKNERTYVMGILNITPDSFSDGGRYNTTGEAVRHVLQMQDDGADFIDVGGQSTRPGYIPISAEQEWERLEPVLRVLCGKLDIPISIDTFYPYVAERALALGACIINDVGGKVARDMAETVAKYQAGWIIMHADAISESENAVDEVRRWLISAAKRAEDFGIEPEQICFDPGIGFEKTMPQNYELIRGTARIKSAQYAYLVGASRKRCIGLPAGNPPFDERDSGTIAAHTIAICGGADMIRVHDVKGAVQAARVADAMLGRTQA